jgi:hypothetical protein
MSNQVAHDDQLRFDELLVRLEEQKRHIVKRLVRWSIMAGGGTLFVIGTIFLLFFIKQYVSVFYFKSPPPASIIEFLDDRPTGSMTFAEFFGHFGEATGGAINLMGLGGLIVSLLLVAEQLEGERRARREQDMPVVFVAPRLVWALKEASVGKRDDGEAAAIKLTEKELLLYLGFRNIGDSAATQIKINVSKVVYSPEKGRDITLEVPTPKVQSMDYLPGRGGAGGYVTGSYDESMQWSLADFNCNGFLNAVLNHHTAESEYPSIRMTLDVSFKTIRNAEFSARGSAEWSPKGCRDVKDYKQRRFLEDFAKEQKKFEEGRSGLDKVFLNADENPLIPFIKEL